jgi:N-acetylglucosaminyldiphosphoundecaprenol N-acetyl-beta-D-mannosaminyltransferase
LTDPEVIDARAAGRGVSLSNDGADRLTAESNSPSRIVLGMRLDATSCLDGSRSIIDWATAGGSRLVCAASVNNVIQGRIDPRYQRVMNEADLVTPDGMPLVWALRGLGVPQAEHVRGTDLTTAVLTSAADEGVVVGFFGGSPEVLKGLLATAVWRWPRLRIAYAYSPPFREMSPAEDEGIVESINASGVRILFVGLGCPKQELWMQSHRDRVDTVMLGVGAAFDFLAGTKKEAPLLMQRTGTEWLFRLATEPRRLWKRYLQQNPRFLALIALQLIAVRFGRRPTEAERTRADRAMKETP